MRSFVISFLDYIRGVKRYSPHTIISYENDLNAFLDFLVVHYDIHDVSKVNHHLIRSWIASMKKDDYSNSSLNRKISSLRSFFKYLRKHDHIDKNPMAKIKALRKPKRLPSFISESKMDHFTDRYLLEPDFREMREYLIIYLLYTTGIRRSELIGLKHGDIDYIRKEIKVLGKGGKERLCPLIEGMDGVINQYSDLKEELGFSSGPQDYLIVTDQGKKAYPKLIYNIVKQVLTGMNASDKASPHVLRHTFATHLASKGADLTAIKELLGHQGLAATQIYTHNSIDRLIKEYNKAHPKGK